MTGAVLLLHGVWLRRTTGCGKNSFVPNLGIIMLQKLSHLVLHVHHLEDGGAVVGDGDVVVRGHHHLVQPPRAQGRLEGVGDGLGGHDVALQGRGQ